MKNVTVKEMMNTRGHIIMQGFGLALNSLLYNFGQELKHTCLFQDKDKEEQIEENLFNIEKTREALGHIEELRVETLDLLTTIEGVECKVRQTFERTLETKYSEIVKDLQGAIAKGEMVIEVLNLPENEETGETGNTPDTQPTTSEGVFDPNDLKGKEDEPKKVVSEGQGVAESPLKEGAEKQAEVTEEVQGENTPEEEEKNGLGTPAGVTPEDTADEVK